MILPEEIRKLQIPKMVRVEQIFANDYLDDTAAAVRAEVEPFAASLPKESTAAVLVGSRGITDIDIIVKTMIDTLKDAGLNPFIVPAMGSHGGGTSEGQEEILRSYGITSQTMGVPMDSSMETEIVGETDYGVEVHFSKPAICADCVIPVGRVKPHTDFNGKVESGLCKMLVIGGGKHNGCSRVHREGFPALEYLIPDCAQVILENVNVPFGLAIIENAFEKTNKVEAVRGSEFLTREPELLNLAKSLMPRIKFDDVDILIVEQIGKNISGTGMDTNIISRDSFGPISGAVPRINRIIIEGLSEGAHGNANGLGMGDFILRPALDKVDFSVTYTNAIAAGNTGGIKIPVICEDEEEAIRAALQTCVGADIRNPRIVRIKDTLHLSEIEVSENMLELCQDKENFRILG